jgi:hypothetical protein
MGYLLRWPEPGPGPEPMPGPDPWPEPEPPEPEPEPPTPVPQWSRNATLLPQKIRAGQGVVRM